MCGIAGILAPRADASWENVTHALHGMAHRGPDGEAITGIDSNGSIAAPGNRARLILGFRRLAIVDPTPRSNQPMRCAATGNLLVFNGEIYNFLELRDELRQCGHDFHTNGDAEVILAAYAEWGDAAFAKMNGMWALALYDATCGELLLSRDRIGVKPFYYATRGDQFYFASELRGVIALLGKLPDVNADAAFDFLAGSAIDHTDATLFEGIRSLPAGALWRIARDGSIRRARYHEWPQHTAITPTPETLHALLTDSVALRLRADAPTVSLLSGGLDSSLITWIAAQHRAQPRSQFIGAFSYGYAGELHAAHDETARAAALIAALPTPIEHTLLRADPRATLDELLALTIAQGLPSTTPSILASHRLYRAISGRGIKVALSGEGADELFAGYTRRYLPRLAHDYLKRGQLRKFVTLLQSPHLSLRALIQRGVWELQPGLVLKMLQRTRPNIATLNPELLQQKIPPFDAICTQQRLSAEACWRTDIVQHALPQILRYADRNSMASGVELRLPFLDYRLVEYALGIPLAENLNANGGKQLLRRAFRGTVPDAFLAQPKTHGFGHAEQFQLPHLSLAPLLERAPAATWEYIDRAKFTKALAQPHTHPMLWLPISFALWMTARAEGAFSANRPESRPWHSGVAKAS